MDCPTRNLSASRNLGVEAAAGEIVVFIDDDALPSDEHWLVLYEETLEVEDLNRAGEMGGAVRCRDTNRF